MLIRSTQLEYPIAFPFKPAQALTTERILSEIERVVQSNQHFRLNDTVDVNVIHVSMPSGGKGSKRTEMNLKKHLEKKKSVVRIQNTDDLCMARALVVAKAKVDDDPSTRVLLIIAGLCRPDWLKNSTPTPAFLLVRVVSKKRNNFKRIWPSIISTLCPKSTTTELFTTVLRKTRKFICTCTTITTT